MDDTKIYNTTERTITEAVILLLNSFYLHETR